MSLASSPAHAGRHAPGLNSLPARIAPGLALCAVVSVAAAQVQGLEQRLFGRAWLEALVLAIVIGAGVRGVWTPGRSWRAGIDFSAKILLEAAVVLLGASISAETLLSVGPALLVGIGIVVAAAIGCSYAIGRGLGLPRRMALLIACGNSICGNSAIAAVAPVIGADGEDVSAAIGFTAVLGVAVVLGLPLLGAALHMSALRFGALAGLTVYAVPQVLAATAPAGAAAVQIGAVVKLCRVLMLGPVCLALSFLARRLRDHADERAPGVRVGNGPPHGHPALHHLVPWFVLGFLAMIALRSSNLIPARALPLMAQAATLLTVISMAALGLSADLRVMAKAGARVIAAVVLSLAALGAISFALITVLRLD
jgi:uncharacterized integral membrane protein (TIGR00698 family)